MHLCNTSALFQLSYKYELSHSVILVFREVCRASTKEWAINKFLYNYTDAAALQIVAKVLGQRALQVQI